MKIVLANGCFDLLHVAHVRHLEEARKMGDVLVVGVTRDRFVNKPGRPIIPEAERLEMVRRLSCVGGVSLCDTGVDAMKQWSPQIFCKGDDYLQKGLLDDEIEYCREHGITIRFTSPNPQTTSGIIERIRKCTFS